jgi:hypothetical protein
MNIDSFLKFFVPKDHSFFPLFESDAHNLVKATSLLKELMSSTSTIDEYERIYKEIQDVEHVGDDITNKTYEQLNKSFITPFDREDIHYLATALDDIADYIYASAKKINFYRVNPNDTGIHKMADIIAQGCVAVHNAVTELRNMKDMRRITDALVAINSIENQGDDIFDMSIEKLFAEENDAKEVIKKREIYQVMEIVTDKCEDAANVIEGIIVKYA